MAVINAALVDKRGGDGMQAYCKSPIERDKLRLPAGYSELGDELQRSLRTGVPALAGTLVLITVYWQKMTKTE